MSWIIAGISVASFLLAEGLSRRARARRAASREAARVRRVRRHYARRDRLQRELEAHPAIERATLSQVDGEECWSLVLTPKLQTIEVSCVFHTGSEGP